LQERIALQKIILLERNPEPKHTRTDPIFKKFNMKTKLKIKINVIRKYFGLYSYPIKPTAVLPNLGRLSL
jgi:hypothetical protein